MRSRDICAVNLPNRHKTRFLIRAAILVAADTHPRVVEVEADSHLNIMLTWDINLKIPNIGILRAKVVVACLLLSKVKDDNNTPTLLTKQLAAQP